MNMVEKVARATFHAECEPHKEETRYKDLWDWLDVMPAVRDRHMAMARAAIAAMMEPNHDMTAAVVPAGYDRTHAVLAWKATIKAALEE